MGRYGLRTEQWERIAHLLPGQESRCRGYREGQCGCLSRRSCIGIGPAIPWRDLPERFGDWKNVHRRFSRWAKSGVWEKVFSDLAVDADNEYAMIDSTIVRAHQRSAGAKKSW